jgi:hypothetical protein
MTAPDLAAIAKLFPKARQSGARWEACCPLHKDGKPSMSLGVKDDKLLVKSSPGATRKPSSPR